MPCVLTGRGGAGERKSDGWLVRAGQGRAVSGRSEGERRVGPVGRAGARAGGPGARGEPGRPVRGSCCEILRDGGWVSKILFLAALNLLGDARDLRELLPVSVLWFRI